METYDVTITWQNATTKPVRADSPEQAVAIIEALGDLALDDREVLIPGSVEVDRVYRNASTIPLALPDTAQVKALWDLLGDVPVDDDGVIQEPYLTFAAGTDREDIWHWFEDTLGARVEEIQRATLITKVAIEQ